MTLKEHSEKCCISVRQINYYCAANHIPDAINMVTIQPIPKDTQKPVDGSWKRSSGECGKIALRDDKRKAVALHEKL